MVSIKKEPPLLEQRRAQEGYTNRFVLLLYHSFERKTRGVFE